MILVNVDVLGLLGDGSISLRDLLDDPGRLHFDMKPSIHTLILTW